MSPADTLRLVAVMVAALAGPASYPIALIEGEQGTGKSTLADMMLSLVDPPAVRIQGRSSFSSDERNLYVRASRAHLLYFDNISIVDQAASDALCRIVTGGSFSTRALYTNDDERTVSVLRPVIATCIGSPTSRGYFLDRCVVLTALRVEHRRTEKRVWAAFEADRRKLFGFLLDAISCSLRNQAEIEDAIDVGHIRAPRLADFAAIIEAGADVFGLVRGEFSAMLMSDQRRIQAESAQGHPFISAILDKLRPGEPAIEMSARELLGHVQPPFPPKNWPAPNQVKRVLMRNAAGLAALGIYVEVLEPTGHAKVCGYRIWRSGKSDEVPSAPPQPF